MIEYYALVLDLGVESPYNKQNPTGLMRVFRNDDGIIYNYEYYNPFRNEWILDSYLYKYFSGDNDTSYPITDEEANEIIESWAARCLN